MQVPVRVNNQKQDTRSSIQLYRRFESGWSKIDGLDLDHDLVVAIQLCGLISYPQPVIKERLAERGWKNVSVEDIPYGLHELGVPPTTIKEVTQIADESDIYRVDQRAGAAEALARLVDDARVGLVALGRGSSSGYDVESYDVRAMGWLVDHQIPVHVFASYAESDEAKAISKLAPDMYYADSVDRLNNLALRLGARSSVKLYLFRTPSTPSGKLLDGIDTVSSWEGLEARVQKELKSVIPRNLRA